MTLKNKGNCKLLHWEQNGSCKLLRRSQWSKQNNWRGGVTYLIDFVHLLVYTCVWERC